MAGTKERWQTEKREHEAAAEVHSACCRRARSLMAELTSSTRAADVGREWMSPTADPRKETEGDLAKEPPKTENVVRRRA